jgi:hypothetical protein
VLLEVIYEMYHMTTLCSKIGLLSNIGRAMANIRYATVLKVASVTAEGWRGEWLFQHHPFWQMASFP